jgi:hypothetical protein
MEYNYHGLQLIEDAVGVGRTVVPLHVNQASPAVTRAQSEELGKAVTACKQDNPTLRLELELYARAKSLFLTKFEQFYGVALNPASIPLRRSRRINLRQEFVGCYSDDHLRDLKVDRGSGHNAVSCASACSGFKYFSLQYHSWCFCGNAYSTECRYKRVPTHQCEPFCNTTDPFKSGSVLLDIDNATLCGSKWRNAIYRNS